MMSRPDQTRPDQTQNDVNYVALGDWEMSDFV